MTIQLNSKTVLACLLTGLLLASNRLRADQSDTHKTVGEMDAYIGVIPAEVIQGVGTGGEKRMHGGVSKQGSRYHLVAALFDQNNGFHITDAHVSVEVTEPSLAVGAHKQFELMKIAEAVTFGNYFDFANNTVSRISLSILVPGKRPVKADFDYSASRR